MLATFTRSDRPLPESFHSGDNIHVCGAGPDYLKAAGTPLLRGRFFTDQDFRHPGTLAVINEAAARAYLSDEDPLGKQIGGGRGSTWKTVIGIAGNTKNDGLNHPAAPQMFVNDLHLDRASQLFFVVRSVADTHALTAEIRSYLHSLDPGLLGQFATLNQEIADMTAGPRFNGMLLAAFAAIAFLMAMIGVYGVLSFAVARRTQEIGIRMAFGAEPRRIAAWIAKEAARLLSVGTIAGVGGALVLTRYLESLLYEVKATDPFTYVGVIAGLYIAAAIATFIPARRAAMVDPVIALRHE